MVDSIMPYHYFRTLLPRLPLEVPNLNLFFAEKANLSLEQVVLLKRAGINFMQPGIESLSSSLLGRMNKGVTAAQNIALLRYARSASLGLGWNLLYGCPGDQLAEYEEILALIPLLHHLHPPVSVSPLHLHRFSPYLESPARFGLRNLRPLEACAWALPPHVDAAMLAYRFAADYESGSLAHPEVVEAMRQAVDAWQRAWFSADRRRPLLYVSRLSREVFLLLDTRGLPGTRSSQLLNREEALAVLAGRRSPQGGVEWAIERKAGVWLDGGYVPLATAEPDLLLEMETHSRTPPFAREGSLPPLRSLPLGRARVAPPPCCGENGQVGRG
jgi:hypothetical protein